MSGSDNASDDSGCAQYITEDTVNVTINYNSFLWSAKDTTPVMGVFVVLVCVGAVCAALLVSGTIIRDGKLRSSCTCILIAGLTINSLLYCISNIFWVGISCFTNTWLSSDDHFWCYGSPVLKHFFEVNSFILLVIISLERTFTVSRPFQSRSITPKKGLVALLVGVLIASLLSVPIHTVIFVEHILNTTKNETEPVIFGTFSGFYKQCVMVIMPEYATYYDISIRLVMLLALLALNSKTIYEIYKMHAKRVSMGAGVPGQGPLLSSSETETCCTRVKKRLFQPGRNKAIIKPTITVFSVVLVFMVSWTPYFLQELYVNINYARLVCIGYSRTEAQVEAFMWYLTYLSPLLTPILFAYNLGSLRKALSETSSEMFHRRSPGGKPRLTVSQAGTLVTKISNIKNHIKLTPLSSPSPPANVRNNQAQYNQVNSTDA